MKHSHMLLSIIRLSSEVREEKGPLSEEIPTCYLSTTWEGSGSSLETSVSWGSL